MTNLTDDNFYDNDDDANENKCTYTEEAQKYFPNISIDGNENNNNNNEEKVYMKLNNDTDIREDPLIWQYFSSSLIYYANYSKILQLNQHQRFRYNFHTLPASLTDALSNNIQLCPNGLSSIRTTETTTTTVQDDEDEDDIVNDDIATIYLSTPPMTTSREPPTFNTSQIETFKFDWMNQAHVFFSIATNKNNTSSTTANPQQQEQELYYNNHMEFVTCLLTKMDQDTLERWAIDENEGIFLTQVLQNKRYHNHPACSEFLPAGSSNNSNNNNTTTIKKSSSSSHTILYYGFQQQQQCCYSACSWLVFLLLLQIVLVKLME